MTPLDLALDLEFPLEFPLGGLLKSYSRKAG